MRLGRAPRPAAGAATTFWPFGSKNASVRALGVAGRPAAKSSARLAALDLVGDVGERVPPPARGSSDELAAGRTPTPGRRPAAGPRVASTTSRLFDVVTTAPGASRIAGTTRAVVLPVRGPPMSSEHVLPALQSSRPPVDGLGRSPSPGPSTPSRCALAAAPRRSSALERRGPRPMCTAARSTRPPARAACAAEQPDGHR